MFDSDLENEISIKLYNFMGELVCHKCTANTELYKLNLSSFANGVYIIEITSGEYCYKRKIQIQK